MLEAHTPDGGGNEYIHDRVKKLVSEFETTAKELAEPWDLGSQDSTRKQRSCVFRVFNGFSGKFNQVLEWSEQELRREFGVVQTLGEQTYSDFNTCEQTELHAEAKKTAFRANFDRTHSKHRPRASRRHRRAWLQVHYDIKDNYLRYQARCIAFNGTMLKNFTNLVAI